MVKTLLTCISMTVTTIFLLGLSLADKAGAASPANTLERLKPSQVIGVVDRVLIDPANPGRHQPVGIRLLKPHSLPAGSVLQAIRIRSGQNATVAELRVTSAQGLRAVAEITRMTSGVSHHVLADYPFLMAGDFVQFSPVSVQSRYRVVAPIAISFAKLFQDPRSEPLSYQLDEAGQQLLREKLKGYGRNRQAILIIEGHTDSLGSWRRNQLESQQRAEVVRRFAIDALGIAPDRVVAVGQGEMEPIDQSHVPGAKERNRRIVIKVQPLSQPST